jgi:fructose-bisphosphate aldolase, class I
MNLGKLVRLNRIFSHPSGRFCSVAADHFYAYGEGLPGGLRHIRPTLEALVAGGPDAVTLHKGVAASAWAPFAGRVPLIIQSTAMHPQRVERSQLATPEDVVRLGADAIAIAAFLAGEESDAATLGTVAECVRESLRFDLPVICHVYPLDRKTGTVLFNPEDVAYAVRCAVECGVDVVKTPYCGDAKAYAQIVGDCPVPLVAAGGPKCDSLKAALGLMSQVVASGARGATIGRNIWGFQKISAAVQAFKAVIHDNKSADEALKVAGLTAAEGATA